MTWTRCGIYDVVTDVTRQCGESTDIVRSSHNAVFVLLKTKHDHISCKRLLNTLGQQVNVFVLTAHAKRSPFAISLM